MARVPLEREAQEFWKEKVRALRVIKGDAPKQKEAEPDWELLDLDAEYARVEERYSGLLAGWGWYARTETAPYLADRAVRRIEARVDQN